jgi:hypothetical protein
MPRYAELSDSEMQSLIHYLRAKARESLHAGTARESKGKM